MTLTAILIFTGAALLYRLLVRTRGRQELLLAASVLAVYWLQPATPIRGLDFWLPTATLALAVLGWAVTAAPAERANRRNLATAGALAGLVLLIALTRYLSTTGILTASRPPQTLSVLLALLIAAGLAAAAWRWGEKTPPLAGVTIGVLLALFVVLKLPELARLASAGLRALGGQNPTLAAAGDLRWLGFSYVAFRLIHTLRDRQSGRLAAVTLQEYLTYLIFFPAFTAGPIDRVERFTRDLRKPLTLQPGDLLQPGARLAVGLFKKFVLADGLAMMALNAQNAAQVSGAGWAWLLVVAYALQIYFDFSGYTDIAVGLGGLMGITLPENFNHPYLKPNLTQFWNNWHMTLTQWFRAYYFNPVTRSLRSGPRKWPPQAVILFTQVTTFVLIGLWHGITWNFVIWGVWHGLGLFVQNRYTELVRPRFAAWEEEQESRRLSLSKPSLSKPGLLKPALPILGAALTFMYVALGWVWFALPTPALALRTLGVLFGM